jgi:hypothetical protein
MSSSPEFAFTSIDKKNTLNKMQVVAFNVDPLFNNAVDGLMYIRIGYSWKYHGKLWKNFRQN